MYALLKLKLIRGKMILFVNTVDRCYKYVRSCSYHMSQCVNQNAIWCKKLVNRVPLVKKAQIISRDSVATYFKVAWDDSFRGS